VVTYEDLALASNKARRQYTLERACGIGYLEYIIDASINDIGLGARVGLLGHVPPLSRKAIRDAADLPAALAAADLRLPRTAARAARLLRDLWADGFAAYG
jgi:hypothetical protein